MEEPRGPTPLSLFWIQKEKQREKKLAGQATKNQVPPPSGQGLDAPLCTTLIHYQADK